MVCSGLLCSALAIFALFWPFMLVVVKVDLAVASSFWLLIMVDSRCSESGLTAASSYGLLLALVLLKYLKHAQISTKTIAKHQNK